MDAFHRRVEAKISSLVAEGEEEKAQTLEAQLARIDAVLSDEELSKLPEVA